MLGNDGGQRVGWTAAPLPAWAMVEPGSGALDGDDRAELVVSVDRTALEEGSSETTMTIRGGGQQAPCRSLLVEERAPEVGAATVSPDVIGIRGCPRDRAAVSVAISDESGVGGATARWTGAGSGTAALAFPSGAWHGQVGPVETPGVVEVIVEATDTRGNTGTGTPVRLQAQPCVS